LCRVFAKKDYKFRYVSIEDRITMWKVSEPRPTPFAKL